MSNQRTLVSHTSRRRLAGAALASLLAAASACSSGSGVDLESASDGLGSDSDPAVTADEDDGFDDRTDVSADEGTSDPIEGRGDHEPAEEPARDAVDADSAIDAAAGEGGLFGESVTEAEPPRTDANTFEDYGFRPFVETVADPLSTFALDVDTGSYAVARRWLDDGVLPDPHSVRVEEFVNSFEYGYSPPENGLALTVDGGPSPFLEGDVLVRIGVQAAVVDDADRGAAALTFVVDTSGSMDRDDRLGLVKDSLEELVEELAADDTIAIVTYGDSSAVVLEPTPARDLDRILGAISDLRPGGSTNLEAGLRTGYELAQRAFVENGVNRVVLASDGVANVGMVDPEQLAAEIHDRAIGGIQLVTVGVGMGNFNDTTMEQLADRGDGFYSYVDTRAEAERLFEDELVATLSPVALDARIQVEWDVDTVESYRLIGFENRGVLDRDFRSETVDAGELSSGHTATAIYELVLADDSRSLADLGEVTLRWQRPSDRNWVEIDESVALDDIAVDWGDADPAMRLATTVTAWAEVLRGSPYVGAVDLLAVADEAASLARQLERPDVEEFAALAAQAADLSRPTGG